VRRLVRLNLAQRIVAVVALAGLLRTVGNYVVTQLTSPGSGWFGYAPLTEGPFPDGFPRGGWREVAMTLVWLVLIAVWAAVSMWLLGLPHARAEDAGGD